MRLGLFPGQGVPATTVLEALDASDPFVVRASEVLGYDLRKKVASSATSKRATLPTWLAQPAIFTAGYCAYMHSVEDGETFEMFAGHSMGEYTALAAAGCFTFQQGLRLVHVRGLAMQRAAQQAPGGMVAILSLTGEEAEEIAAGSGASVANHNAPLQTVLSGTDASIAEASRLARERGGRAVLLGVAAPFHTIAMEPAAAPLGHALVYTTIRSPRVPVVSNVTARPYRHPGEIRRLLVQQLTHPVLFRQSLQWAFETGVDSFHDFGPGTVVDGLASKTFEEKREVIRV